MSLRAKKMMGVLTFLRAKKMMGVLTFFRFMGVLTFFPDFLPGFP